jgi:flagellar biosynthetic protein FlhB
VLAYVYQLKAAMAGRGTTPVMPNPPVPPELDPHNKPVAKRDGDDALEDEA